MDFCICHAVPYRKIQDLEVHEGRIKCEQEIQEHARRIHIDHVKRCLNPKCPIVNPV